MNDMRQTLDLLDEITEGPSPKMTPGKRQIKKDAYAKQNGNCWMCEQPFPIEYMTLDHTLPRARGGGNSADNFTLMCYPCNSMKGDRILVSRSVDHAKKELTVVFKI